MIVDARPLTVPELQGLGGRLVWEEAEIDLCADWPVGNYGTFIEVRRVGDGFLHIGDGFQSNNQGAGCDINTAMAAAFASYCPPDTACVWVKTGRGVDEYCAPLAGPPMSPPVSPPVSGPVSPPVSGPVSPPASRVVGFLASGTGQLAVAATGGVGLTGLAAAFAVALRRPEELE